MAVLTDLHPDGMIASYILGSIWYDCVLKTDSKRPTLALNRTGDRGHAYLSWIRDVMGRQFTMTPIRMKGRPDRKVQYHMRLDADTSQVLFNLGIVFPGTDRLATPSCLFLPGSFLLGLFDSSAYVSRPGQTKCIVFNGWRATLEWVQQFTDWDQHRMVSGRPATGITPQSHTPKYRDGGRFKMIHSGPAYIRDLYQLMYADPIQSKVAFDIQKHDQFVDLIERYNNPSMDPKGYKRHVAESLRKRQVILSLTKAGISPVQIAKQLGITSSAVYWHLKKDRNENSQE